MSEHVYAQCPLLGVSLIAFVTSISFVACMEPLVLLQIVFGSEGTGAHVTLVRLLVGVNTHMFDQRFFPPTLYLAQITLKGRILPFLMDKPHVPSQI